MSVIRISIAIWCTTAVVHAFMAVPRPGALIAQRQSSLGSLFFSLPSSIEEKSVLAEEDSQNQNKVQRFYETYQWSQSPSSTSTSPTYNINYRVEGNPTDPPLLLIHGFGANVNQFRFNFPLLTQAGYRVYAIDLLGFGASDKPKEEEYCIELWLDLLCDFIKDMERERETMSKNKSTARSSDSTNDNDPQWVVAGNSIGGLCALGVTARLQQTLVRGCTLFNAAGGMTSFRYEELPWILRPFLLFLQKVILSPDGYGGKFFENFKTRQNVESILLNQGVYRDTTNVNEELMEILLGPSDDDGAKEVFLKVFGGPAGPTPESFLEEIYKPVLALWGSADPWTPVDRGLHPGKNFGKYHNKKWRRSSKSESDEMNESLSSSANMDQPSFQLHILEGAGHCPHDEVPDAIHEVMLPWLRNLDGDNSKEEERGE